MSERMRSWLTTMALSEGVGLNRLQFTTKKSMSFGSSPRHKRRKHQSQACVDLIQRL